MLNSYQTQLENAFRAQQLRQQANQQSSSFIGDMLQNSRKMDQQQAQFDQQFNMEKEDKDRRFAEEEQRTAIEALKSLIDKGLSVDGALQLAGQAGIQLDETIVNSTVRYQQEKLTTDTLQTQFQGANTRAAGSIMGLTQTPDGSVFQPNQTANLDGPKTSRDVNNLRVATDIGKTGTISDKGQEEMRLDRTSDQFDGSMKAIKASDNIDAHELGLKRGGAMTDAQEQQLKQQNSQFWASLEANKKNIEAQGTEMLRSELNKLGPNYQKALAELQKATNGYGGNVTKIITDAMTQKQANWGMEELRKLNIKGLNLQFVKDQLELVDHLSAQSAALAGTLVKRGVFDEKLGRMYVLSQGDMPMFDSFSKDISTGANAGPGEGAGAGLSEEDKAKLRARAEQQRGSGVLDSVLGQSKGFSDAATLADKYKYGGVPSKAPAPNITKPWWMGN